MNSYLSNHVLCSQGTSVGAGEAHAPTVSAPVEKGQWQCHMYTLVSSADLQRPKFLVRSPSVDIQGRHWVGVRECAVSV